MKKTLVLISLSLLAICLMAQKPMATFFSEDGYKFWVIMDGKRMNPEPQYRVENIPMENDWAKVKIIFEDANLEPVEKTIQGVDADGNPSAVTWVIKQSGKGKWKITASSWKTLDAATESAPQTVPANERQQPSGVSTESTVVTTQTTTTSVSDPNQTNVSMSMGENNVSMKIDINDGSEAANMDINMSLPGISTQQETTTTTTTTTITTASTTTAHEINEVPAGIAEQPVERPNPLPGYNGRTGCNDPMSTERFERAKSSIETKTFEDSKMTVARQILKSNCLLVSQVKEIMQLFTFEDNKLSFAIEAYQKTYDIDNYYELNDVFTFESSIDELNEKIGE